MNEPSILFVKPGAIHASDKEAAQKAGIIVIEIEDPLAVKFIRAATEMSSSAMLVCAMKAMLNADSYTSTVKTMFAENVGKEIAKREST